MSELQILAAPPLQLPLLVRSELLAAGMTERQIRWRLRTGQWVQLRAGIYVEAAVLAALPADSIRRHALDVEAARRRLRDDTVASHESAARLLGMKLLSPPLGVRVTRASDQERQPQRYRGLLVRVSQLPPEHLHPTLIDGIPLTGAARTAIDLGRTATLRQSVVTADSALALGRMTPEELAAALDWAKQWPGTQQAEAMVMLADGRRESPFESESFVGFYECGLELPEPQVVIGDGSGQTARVDNLWREHHTVGEADGLGKYVDRADKLAERERQLWIESLGLEVVRWAPEEIHPRRMRGLCRKIEAAFVRAHRRWGD